MSGLQVATYLLGAGMVLVGGWLIHPGLGFILGGAYLILLSSNIPSAK